MCCGRPNKCSLFSNKHNGIASIQIAFRRMTEQYYLAITQVVGQVCCDRSYTVVLGVGFQPDSPAYTHTADSIYSISTCAGPSETYLLRKSVSVCTQSNDRMVIEEGLEEGIKLETRRRDKYYFVLNIR